MCELSKICITYYLNIKKRCKLWWWQLPVGLNELSELTICHSTPPSHETQEHLLALLGLSLTHARIHTTLLACSSGTLSNPCLGFNPTFFLPPVIWKHCALTCCYSCRPSFVVLVILLCHYLRTSWLPDAEIAGTVKWWQPINMHAHHLFWPSSLLLLSLEAFFLWKGLLKYTALMCCNTLN